jgi:uncharacterized protein YndB with AHSA1/START domain
MERSRHPQALVHERPQFRGVGIQAGFARRRAGARTLQPRGQGLYINNTIIWHIVPDRRIALSYTMGTDAGPFSASLVTVEITLKGNGSHLLFTEQAAFFDNADGPEKRKEG